MDEESRERRELPGGSEAVSYTLMEGAQRRPTVTRHGVLVALCSAAVVVCCLGAVAHSTAEPGDLSSKLLFGADVGSDDVANSILDSARRKYEASKQRLKAKHQAAAPSKPAAPKAAVEQKAAPKAAKTENALTLEQKIAEHKITTRDLVKEVQAKQKQQAKAMAGQLQDQTDDLIVASIRAMKKKETGKSGTVGYVLKNALTKTEQQSLARGAGQPKAAPPAAAPAQEANIDVKAVISQAAAASPQPQMQAKQVGVHPQLMETPPGMSLNNKKAPNTEGMLSSYDQQLLKEGPDGIDAGDSSESPAPAPALPQNPPAAAYQPTPGAPQYAQPQYQAPPYQQLAGGMPAPQYPYQQPAQYQQYQPPQYAEEPQYAQYQQQPQYQQPQYSPYQGQQLYAAPAYEYGYTQPEYAQPYQQPYAYPQPMYAQYQQQPQYAPQQQMAAVPRAPPAAPAAPPPSPAQLLEKAKRLLAQQHGGAAAPATAAPQPQALAAYTTAGPNGGGGGGGLLWRMFTAPESGPSPAAPPPKQYSAVINNGGFQAQQMATAPGSAGQSLQSNMGAGSMAAIDPQNLGVGSQKDAEASLSMSSSAKQSIKAKMEALRQGILNDFKHTTDIGAQAGYLPPPPMP